MYDKIYLIDSENISDEWVDILDRAGVKDHITVFYTDKSTHIHCGQVCKLMEKGAGKVQWVKCMEGNNALDFQLVTELGAMIERNDAGEYIIISKDNGFNVVVSYWNNRNIQVSKMNVKAFKENSGTKAAAGKESYGADTVSEQKDSQAEEARQTEEVFQEPALIRELLKTVNLEDHSLLYGALVAFEGQGSGVEDYRRLRDYDKEMKEKLQGLYVKDRQKRGVAYLELVLSQNQCAKDEGRILYEMILNGPKKKKDKFHKALISRYGKAAGSDYYRMIKPHYNLIKKL